MKSFAFFDDRNRLLFNRNGQIHKCGGVVNNNLHDGQERHGDKTADVFMPESRFKDQSVVVDPRAFERVSGQKEKSHRPELVADVFGKGRFEGDVLDFTQNAEILLVFKKVNEHIPNMIFH